MTPSGRIDTTQGPMPGRHARPAIAPAKPSSGRMSGTSLTISLVMSYPAGLRRCFLSVRKLRCRLFLSEFDVGRLNRELVGMRQTSDPG